MAFEFLTLDDVEVGGKTVFLRVDINSPIDPSSKRILDAKRITETLDTIRELEEARVVLGAHQSRPGRYDFTSLELHARVLQMYLNDRVRFVDDVLGERAQAAIRSLRPGDILVLNNLRMVKEENMQAPPEELTGTGLVQTLYPFFDLVVNDAFAAAHRSQPSLVGFGEVLPMVAQEPQRPCVFVLGGAKVEDRLPVMRRVLRDGISDRILIGGLIRDAFHMAQGHDPGRLATLSEQDRGLVAEAGELMDQYGDRIEMPVDVALDVGGERLELHVSKLTDERNIYDIGLNTLARYCDQVKRAGTAVAEGPLGMFERRFFDIEDKLGHVSTGGGAMLSLLAGEEMPVIQALERAKKRFG